MLGQILVIHARDIVDGRALPDKAAAGGLRTGAGLIDHLPVVTRRRGVRNIVAGRGEFGLRGEQRTRADAHNI
jgi:hypothetical protein